jgi:hypothetical protein
MSGVTGPGRPRPRSSVATGRRWLPFWVLQASEVAVAVVLVNVSVHVSRGTLLPVAAAVLGGLAVTARGPLGIFRVCGQRLHVYLVTAAAVAIAVAPIVPALRPGIEGIIVVVFGAIGLLRLATLTRVITPGPVAAGGGPGAEAVIDVTASLTPPVSPGAGAVAGHTPAAGSTPSEPSATPPGPGPSRTAASSGAAARWVGRTTGIAAARGRRAAVRHRPEVEETVKRTIRGAGRMAGRMASSSEPGDPVD